MECAEVFVGCAVRNRSSAPGRRTRSVVGVPVRRSRVRVARRRPVIVRRLSRIRLRPIARRGRSGTGHAGLRWRIFRSGRAWPGWGIPGSRRAGLRRVAGDRCALLLRRVATGRCLGIYRGVRCRGGIRVARRYVLARREPVRRRLDARDAGRLRHRIGRIVRWGGEPAAAVGPVGLRSSPRSSHTQPALSSGPTTIRVQPMRLFLLFCSSMVRVVELPCRLVVVQVSPAFISWPPQSTVPSPFRVTTPPISRPMPNTMPST